MSENFTYKQTDSNPDLFTVGVQCGDSWEPESDHCNPDAAANRCNFLNGGSKESAAAVPGMTLIGYIYHCGNCGESIQMATSPSGPHCIRGGVGG